MSFLPLLSHLMSSRPVLPFLGRRRVRPRSAPPPGGPGSSRGWSGRSRPRVEAGQATAEYALVLLGAAVVAIALVTWATQSGRIGQLFDAVFDELAARM